MMRRTAQVSTSRLSVAQLNHQRLIVRIVRLHLKNEKLWARCDQYISSEPDSMPAKRRTYESQLSFHRVSSKVSDACSFKSLLKAPYSEKRTFNHMS